MTGHDGKRAHTVAEIGAILRRFAADDLRALKGASLLQSRVPGFRTHAPAVISSRSEPRAVEPPATGRAGRLSADPYIKGAMVSLPAAYACLSGPSCALCKWRRLGDLIRPLTASEWARVFREPAA